MSLYSFQKKRISRGKGYSVCEAIAYRAGIRIEDHYYGLEHDYTNKSDILYHEVMLPFGSPPYDSETLWNNVEEINTRSNSQLAHELVLAQQVEFSIDKQIDLLREFIQNNIISRGLGADFAIHETIKEMSDGTVVRNPHAHVLIPTRFIGADGLGAIDRSFNDYSTLISLRKEWEVNQSNELKKMELDGISHESYAVQDINTADKREPKQRLSPKEIALDRKYGIQTDRVTKNNEIEQQRKIKKELENQIDLNLNISKGIEF
jgi:hypothetical protein